MDRQNFRASGSRSHQAPNSASSGLKTRMTASMLQPQIVDFHSFQLDYWPHFPPKLTKDLPIELVFSEIMGVIKGSISSKQSLAPLGLEDYLNRNSRLAPSFVLEDDRKRVFEIFKSYEKTKFERREEDLVDRVVHILEALRKNPELKQKLSAAFDEFYIDGMAPYHSFQIVQYLSNNEKKCKTSDLLILSSS